MLKPSGLQNCEKDEDQLLVSVLQRSSEALQGQKVNAKKASAVTMQALTKMIGAGFQDEDWASEGEEVAEEDAVNISLARSELEIMDALGGYVAVAYGKLFAFDLDIYFLMNSLVLHLLLMAIAYILYLCFILLLISITYKVHRVVFKGDIKIFNQTAFMR